MPAAGTAVVAVLGTLAGAVWGLVVPALVDRYAVVWPDGETRPAWRTACPECGAERGPWWRAPRRCAGCGRRFAPGRWSTVPLTGLTGGVVAAAVGPTPALPAFLLLVAVGVPLALVDLTVLRLPDPLVGAAFGAGVLMLGAAALLGHDRSGPVRGLTAAVATGLLYAVLALLPRAQLGFGDVKLGAVLGWYLGFLGWLPAAAAVLLTPVMNLPLVVALLATGRAGRRTPIPYGPGMLAAAVAATVVAALR